jgi:hypothetical protein
MELREREKGRENDRASVILHTIQCKGRGCKDVYSKLLKIQEEGGKGVRVSIRRDLIDQSKAHPQRAYIETSLCKST